MLALFLVIATTIVATVPLLVKKVVDHTATACSI